MTAPPPCLVRRSIDTTRDLTQARHELHRLLDFPSDDAALADWARKWGEGALDAVAYGRLGA